MEFSFATSADKSIAQLAALFSLSFSNYEGFDPLDMSAETFGDYVRAFQIDVARSILGYIPDGEAAGCAMLGIRGQRGWLGGFGIVPDLRGKGLSGPLLEKFIEQCRQLKLKSVTLEVLHHNIKAQKLYSKAGFKIIRDTVLYAGLDNMVQEVIPAVELEEERELEPALALVAPGGLPEQNREFPPCWQCETPSVLGQRGAKARLARLSTGEQGMIIYVPQTARRKVALLQAGFDPSATQEAQAILLSSLLHSAAATFGPPAVDAPAASFSTLNEPAGSNLALLLEKLGFTETWHEYEMLLKLDA